MVGIDLASNIRDRHQSMSPDVYYPIELARNMLNILCTLGVQSHPKEYNRLPIDT